MRGVAAALVVLFHAHGAVGLKFPAEISLLNSLFHIRDIGVVGVDLFFVVSGFIMFYVYAAEFGKPGAALDFFVRRIIRIVPLYWLLSLALLCALVFLPNAFGVLRFEWRHAVDSFLFLPTLNSAGEPFPVLNSGWTLTYEMYFYLLFALCLGRTPMFALATVTLVFLTSALAGVLFFSGDRSPIIGLLVNPILIEFVLGGCLGFLVSRGKTLPVPLAMTIGVAGCAALAMQAIMGMWDTGRVLGRGVPCLFIVAGLVSGEISGLINPPRWLRKLGDESYSLYLTHVATGAIFFKLCTWFAVAQWTGVDVLIPAYFVAAVLVGKCSYMILERPMLLSLGAAWSSRKAGRTESAAR